MSRKKYVLLIVVGIAIALLMDHFVWNDKIVGEPPVPTVNYGALHLERVSYPTCGDTSYDRYCTHHGSGWNAYGVGNASAAGKIGPRWVKIPAKVRANFRAAVFRKGSSFTAKVRKAFKQFDHSVWKVECTMAVGQYALRKSADPSYRMLPKCMTAKQMLAVAGTKVWHPALKCAGDAFLGTGVGYAITKTGKGGVIVALGSGVTCAVTGAWNYYVDSGGADADGKWMWKGFKTLTVAEAKALHYMF